jgi:hypothetical protein
MVLFITYFNSLVTARKYIYVDEKNLAWASMKNRHFIIRNGKRKRSSAVI